MDINYEYIERFIKEVRLRREKLLMSQKDLEKKSGVTKATISAIERGRIMISFDTATKLATALLCDFYPSFIEREIQRPEDVE